MCFFTRRDSTTRPSTVFDAHSTQEGAVSTLTPPGRPKDFARARPPQDRDDAHTQSAVRRPSRREGLVSDVAIRTSTCRRFAPLGFDPRAGRREPGSLNSAPSLGEGTHGRDHEKVGEKAPAEIPHTPDRLSAPVRARRSSRARSKCATRKVEKAARTARFLLKMSNSSALEIKDNKKSNKNI